MKKINMPVSVQWRFNALVHEIRKYESDTFSASAERITQLEAERIAARLVKNDINDRIATNTMDGVDIMEELNDLRDRH